MNLRTAKALLRDAATEVAGAVAEILGAETAIGRIRVRIGVQYATVQDVLAEKPEAYDGTWHDWATATYKGGPDVYRLLHAGRVAMVLGDDIAEATERHLAPLYRILKAAEKGSDEDREKAQQKVRDVWTRLNAKRKATDPMPSEEKVLEAVDRATGSSGGTRGKQAGSTTSGGKRSTRKARAAAQTEQPSGSEVIVLPTEPEKAQLTLAGKVRKGIGAFDAESLTGVQHYTLAIIALVRTYGSAAVEAAVRSEIRDARDAAKGKAKKAA